MSDRHRLELRDLRLISVVSEVGSLTRAAGRLNVTQSALSHQLRLVEDRLGTPVFHRVGKRMVLTRAGQRLLETARHVLAEITDAEDEIRGLRDPRQATLRVTTECYTCYHWLPPLLADYRLRHPMVEGRIDLDATRDPLPKLLDGSLDLAIVSSQVDDRRLATTPLFRDDLTLVASPRHPLATKSRMRLADLADETLFIYPPRSESVLLNQVLRPAGVAPRIEEVPLTEAAIELVKAGLGVAALANWAVRAELQAGRLVALPLTGSALRRRWSAAMLRQSMDVPLLHDFVELLAAKGRFQTTGGGRTA